jgi:outer membrane lipoprotein-sorting protein
MNTLKLYFFLTLSILAVSATPFEAPGAQEIDRISKGSEVDEIINKYVRAIGGQDAILKIKSRLAKGTIEVPGAGLQGTAEIWTEAPNRFLSITTFSGKEVNRVCFDGKTGWAQDLQIGLRDLAGKELSQLKRHAEFYPEIRLKEQYVKMVLTGTEKVNARSVHIIEATPADDRPEKLYFDDESGLLVRKDTVNATPTGQQPTQWYYENYRDVDGVKVAFTWRAVTPVATAVFKLSEVKSNVAVSDGLFLKPKT